MKKALFTLSAIALFSWANAQSVKTEKWPNGNKKSEGVVIGDAKVTPNATKEEQAREMNNISRDGKWTTWYESGKVRTEENYDKGTMVGVWKGWYENGQVESDINYTTGTAVIYFNTGQINSQGGMASGAIHTGKWVGFYENGTKNYEGSYTNAGQKDGLWIWYNEKGVKTTEQNYSNGTLLSTKDLTK